MKKRLAIESSALNSTPSLSGSRCRPSTLNTANSVLRRDGELCAELWSKNHLLEVYYDLCELGHRLIGSPGEQRAQDLLQNRISSLSLEPEFDTFESKTYHRGEARAAVIRNNTRYDLACQAFVYSDPTVKPLDLDLVDVGTADPEHLDSMGEAFKDLAAWCLPDDEMRSKRYRDLSSRGAAACVFGSHLSHHDGCVIGIARPLDNGKRVPAIGLGRKATQIIDAVARLGGGRLHLEVKGETHPATVGNLSVLLPGRTDLPEIVVGAHLDTYDLCEGAQDNTTGVAMVAELIRAFRALPPLRRSIRFVFFTGEEVGCLGSRHFVEHRCTPAPALYFNIDMPVEGGIPGILFTTDKTPPEFWADLRDDLGHPFPTEAVPGRSSDHGPFAQQNIPCVWTRAFHTGSRGHAAVEHTALDTVDKVDLLEFRESCLLTGRLLLRFAEAEEALLGSS